MIEIIFVAVIFFCDGDECSVIAKSEPYKQETLCKQDVKQMSEELIEKGAVKVEGRCLDVKVPKYI